MAAKKKAPKPKAKAKARPKSKAKPKAKAATAPGPLVVKRVEFPKWVNGVVVDNAVQEKAVLAGTAKFSEVHSTQGIERKVL